MRLPRLPAAVAAVGALILTAVPAAPSAAMIKREPVDAAPRPDPATWSDSRLARQLTFSCVPAAATRSGRAQAAAGIGGITLVGGGAPARLADRLTAVRAAAPRRVLPVVASDEEGGSVQRLRQVIHPLPAARTMGTWSPERVERTAYRYGVRMRALGVTMDFGPVADLGVPGHYIQTTGRAFGRSPHRVAVAAAAWMDGMRRAGVVPVIKHWPGHGHGANTHTRPAAVPARRVLQRRDMRPFDAAFQRGVPAVMVGHLASAGLTEPGRPASESPRALRYLRSRVGPTTVIITDSLWMAAASSALGISPARAAVRALRAGADWALACDTDPRRVARAIRRAIDRGSLDRAAAVTKVRRILELKTAAGLVR